MEGVIAQKLTPLLKCLLLLLFIFTAKVLTSRPVDEQESLNSVQHQKPAPYVRTFTKYHHRRTIPWNGVPEDHWPLTQDHVKVKRSLEDAVWSDSNFYPQSSLPNNLIVAKKVKGSTGKENVSEKNNLNDIKKYKVKAAIIVTEPPATVGPRISCLYKINSVSLGSTPAYDEKKNEQHVVENEDFDIPGPLSETILPNGETAQVEQCTDSHASCYTLWHQGDDGNTTVLGQGCWRTSQKAGQHGCDKCTRVTPRLPGTRFCCCTKDYCNAEFSTLEDYVVTPKAELTVDTKTNKRDYSHVISFAIFAMVAMLVLAIVFKRVYCKKVIIDKEELSDGLDVEKVDIMGSGPDAALATGLLCVDNLTLIEHIGQGKFGSVWRGSFGSMPVAVKLYSSALMWQKEADIYSMSHLTHPNILKYYGSDTRPMLTEGGARERLIVLELCSSTLRRRLEDSPLSWQQFATLAHGLAAALAHLHSVGVNKPCIVHRDVNSNNVLLSLDGSPRLADLGLAQVVHSRKSQPAPRRITEAGTLRYLAPEALEGALDLSGARAALCAVDVFAMGLVLWEMLWRTAGAHAGVTPPYCPPYQLQGLGAPTLPQMQNLVSRNKVRPPLPKGPVSEVRALKIANDTCDECWDHDAEARLTAVCVEERMAELKQMLRTQKPIIHDNNLHSDSDGNMPSHQESEKNSNCVQPQRCDVTTPLLYTQPHMGKNPCLERNTNVNTQTHTVQLIHKSLKDINVSHDDPPRSQNIDENCLSVARVSHNRIQMLNDQENSDRMNEIRTYQRPLDFVSNDVSSIDVENRGLKETNLLHDVKIEKAKWGIRKFFERKLHKNSKPLETEVKLLPENLSNGAAGPNLARTKTTILNDKPCNLSYINSRPSNLVLTPENQYNFEGPCTLSPPNRTLSPTMMMESEMNKSEKKIFGFKELPSRNREETGSKQSNHSHIFAVIVPKAKPNEYKDSSIIIEMHKTRGSSESLNKSVKTSMSSQSLYKSGNSESEDSTFKKRLSCDNKITNNSNSGRSSRLSINLELQYINNENNTNEIDSPFDINSDCSSSEDEHLMLLSENGGSKITMQAVPKNFESLDSKKKYQNDVLKESSQTVTDFGFNKYNTKYKNFDNEFSDPNDKENLVNGYSGDNPCYLAALNGEIATDLKFQYNKPDEDVQNSPKSPKPCLKNLAIKRQHSLEQVGEIFTSSGDVHLQNPAGRVKTPGDLPVAIRRARRDRALQRGRANESNRLSLYDDRMMFGNSL